MCTDIIMYISFYFVVVISQHAILSVITLNLTENDCRVFDFIYELYNKRQTHTSTVIQ